MHARSNNEFLILCGYDPMLSRFHEYLKLAYINSRNPENQRDEAKISFIIHDPCFLDSTV
jgi:hypothetical protein